MDKNDLEEKKTAARGGAPSVQSVRRAIEILQCFNNNEALTLTQISKKVGLHKSTTYGIVSTLREAELLYKNEETEKYQLGTELCRIAANVRVGLRNICLPHIGKLCVETDETVNLVIPDDTSVIYLEKTESQHSVRSCTSIGMRLPMYCTAVGKAILAYLPPEEASAVLDRSMLVPRTVNTLTSKDAILKEIQNIRLTGYAVDQEELEEGLVCVAVPVLNLKGNAIAAISCSGPKQRMKDDRVQKIAELLLQHARQVSYIIN